MIILDTNVVSEPLRPKPAEVVVAWLDAQSIETLYLTTLTLAELRFGIAVMPKGRRRTTLGQRFEQEFLPAFADRILVFDEPATTAYAELRARARAAGVAIGATDGYIAAIAASRGFAVATRDRTPFAAAGLRVIDPFEVSET